MDGTNKGYKIAWSNQPFEYWLYLHFNYSDSALHRDAWNEKLDNIFEQYQLGNGTYQKNYENIFDLVNSFNGVDTAINNAKRRMAEYTVGVDRPSEYDPGTMVYKLVEELKVFPRPIIFQVFSLIKHRVIHLHFYHTILHYDTE